MSGTGLLGRGVAVAGLVGDQLPADRSHDLVGGRVVGAAGVEVVDVAGTDDLEGAAGDRTTRRGGGKDVLLAELCGRVDGRACACARSSNCCCCRMLPPPSRRPERSQPRSAGPYLAYRPPSSSGLLRSAPRDGRAVHRPRQTRLLFQLYCTLAHEASRRQYSQEIFRQYPD